MIVKEGGTVTVDFFYIYTNTNGGICSSVVYDGSSRRRGHEEDLRGGRREGRSGLFSRMKRDGGGW
jgi:hypothetical protein